MAGMSGSQLRSRSKVAAWISLAAVLLWPGFLVVTLVALGGVVVGGRRADCEFVAQVDALSHRLVRPQVPTEDRTAQDELRALAAAAGLDGEQH